LVEMSASQVKGLPLEKDIRDEIANIRGIGNLAARRRQTKYLAKILRRLDDEESEELLAHVARFRQTKEKETENFHQIEAWRDRLCEEGASAVDILARTFPAADLTNLRNAVSRFQDTHGKHEYRLVFQLLRGIIGGQKGR
ncbi:MAG: DUF615 domain-containing protein, partial [Nitrospirota bacterium]|nr:DUF615 domain-containing protein [Nitrospirota bacterium]